MSEEALPTTAYDVASRDAHAWVNSPACTMSRMEASEIAGGVAWLGDVSDPSVLRYLLDPTTTDAEAAAIRVLHVMGLSPMLDRFGRQHSDSELWDRYMGEDDPRTVSIADVREYIDGSDLCSDLEEDERSALDEALTRHILKAGRS